MSGLLQTFEFLGTLAGAPIIDRFGRRATFLAGLGIQLFVLFLSAAFAKASGDTIGVTSQSWGSAAAATVYIYQFTLCSTTLVICWVYPTEIGWAMGAGSTTQALPSMFAALDLKTMIVFACFNFAAIQLVYFFFPESGLYRSLVPLRRWVSPYGTNREYILCRIFNPAEKARGDSFQIRNPAAAKGASKSIH